MSNTSRHVYMDYNAGKPVHPRVAETMQMFLQGSFGNPSSLHSKGQEAKTAVENARQQVAKLINAEKKESILFTSGATESNNLAIKGFVNRNKERGNRLITSSVEHMSVLNPCKYLKTKDVDLVFLPVDNCGSVELEALKREIATRTVLVSIVCANGEIGTIEPIREISRIVHEKESYLHVDATAANGMIPLDVQSEGIDLLTLSSNDIYGPRGVGALYVKEGLRLEPLFQGGGQERGLRSGTENVAGIVGFGQACEIAQKEMSEESERLIALRDRMIKALLESVPYAFLNGHPSKRLPNNVSVRYNFIEGEAMLLSLEMLGVQASSGSACTSKTLEPSHVLLAMGLRHEEAHGSLMFSLGRQNNQEDVDYVVGAMPEIVKRLRRMSPLTPKELKQ